MPRLSTGGASNGDMGEGLGKGMVSKPGVIREAAREDDGA
jgi:hypothetical protein